MGSLCCVAAKSDRSDSASRDFSFGPHEPYWRTNTSFSPPSSRWDVPGLTGGISLYGSSTSSNANHNTTKPQRAVSSIFRCGLCNRYISQKSPCGSRSIVRNRDMPVTGVLPCQHVFHAECLDQSTPKAHRGDPPCLICIKQEGEQSKSHNIVLRLKPFCEDGPSSTRQWACAQVGDCVESAVNVPPRNTMVMVNRNRMRKSLPLRGSSSKDSPRRVKKSSSFMESFTNQVSLVHSRGKEKV
ncbi:RING/U-box superfamily protein [Raphanus sativus]|uniref:Uncharacterized protein LOC108814064 n=1 Tax=Raphanus sativus TaxID=3726 RepID=A0A6J0K359_RAPSA|nr:uncharacterized protein LOC108814064 [Raphanus sativus]XP_018442089.1 uncharacterized protein LOC108814064 [Raphanus sativus]XP_018442090.1 uncharacterized protein LOC108814064 [Raphanus sativus]KAJ4915723.1 RING/U-box superfamily protein [Raphanus sativus]